MTYENQHYQQQNKKINHSVNYQPYNRPMEKRNTEKQIIQSMQQFEPKEWYKR